MAASSSLKDLGVIVRFVPDGWAWRAERGKPGRWRLRGVLALLPDPAVTTLEALEAWPERIDALLAASNNRAWVQVAAPLPADVATTETPIAAGGDVLHDAGQSDAGPLWRALLAPELDLSNPDTLHPKVREVIAAARETGPYPEVWRALHRPWESLLAQIAGSLDSKVGVSLTAGAPDPLVSVTAADALADAARGIGAARLLSHLVEAQSARRAGQLDHAPEFKIETLARHLTSLLGVTPLFQQTPPPAGQATDAQLQKTLLAGDGAPAADAHLASVLAAVQRTRFAVESAPAAAPAGQAQIMALAPADTKQTSSKPGFNRMPPPAPAGPAPIPPALRDAIDRAVGRAMKTSMKLRPNLRKAIDDFDKLSRGGLLREWTSVWLDQQSDARPATFTRQLRDALRPLDPPDRAPETGDLTLQSMDDSFGATSGGAFGQPVVEALADHILATRADAPVTPRGGVQLMNLDETDHRPAMDPDKERHQIALQLADAPSRRFFGLFALPSLARALKLVLDVEIDIDPDTLEPIARVAHAHKRADGDEWMFSISATLAASDPPAVWSAAKIFRPRRRAVADAPPGRFVPTTREEIALAERGEATALEPQQRDGLLNLGLELIGQPRFQLDSLDVTGHAEQLLNKAQSEAHAVANGRPLAEVAGYAPDRSAGVVLIDAARKIEIEHQGQNADAQSGKLAGQSAAPLVMFADDLTIGHRLDVAVTARDGASKGKPTWRSLMQRTIRFGTVTAKGRQIHLERLITRAVTAAAPLRTSGGSRSSAAKAFRRHLDEGSFKAAARVVASTPPKSGEKPKDPQFVGEQRLVVWTGDPLGAACTADRQGAEADPARDLALPLTFGLPREDDPGGARPPRLEVDRDMTVGARQAFIGGGGLTVDEAASVYEAPRGGRLTLPPRNEPRYRFRRHERVAKPNLALLHRPKLRLRKAPDEGVELVVVRSGEPRFQKRHALRMVYAPAVPQSFAALHPAGPVTGRSSRVLDTLPILGGRPVGGLPHVMLDPDTGGLPIRVAGRVRYAERHDPKNRVPEPTPSQEPQVGVFCLRPNGATVLAGRKAPYYPDPAVDALVVELWTRSPGPHALGRPETRTVVPIYDPRFNQSVPYGLIDGLSWTACVYPYAMPLLIEVNAVEAKPNRPLPRVEHRPRGDTGCLLIDGSFLPLAPGMPPPPGTTTAQRVRIDLAPGQDFDVKVWASIPAERMGWFAAVENAGAILSAVGSPGGARPSGQPLGSLKDGAKAVLGIQLDSGGGAQISSTSKTGLRDDRGSFHAFVAQRLTDAPLPDRAEVTTFRAVHATQRPPQPSLHPELATEAFKLVRHTFADEAAFATWSRKTDGQGDWGQAHQTGAAMAWFGGALRFDLRQASKLTVIAQYKNIYDNPDAPLPVTNGKLDWPTVGRVIVDHTLDDDPYHPTAASGRISLLTRLDGMTRALSHKFPGPEARQLTLIPVAGSRFAELFPARADEPKETFQQAGAPHTYWLLATRRPASLEHVEILPAFAWTSQSGSAERATWLRLRWRRKAPPPSPGQNPPTNAWFSSGEGERLAVLLDPVAARAGRQKSAVDIEVQTRLVSAWGRDAIRTGTAPANALLSKEDLAANLPKTPSPDAPAMQAGLHLPIPPAPPPADGTAAPPSYAFRDAITFMPVYVPEEDLWQVELQVGADGGRDPASRLPGPWLQLALARYQEHAINDPRDPARDLRLSTALTVDCPTTPYRRVEVRAGRRDKVERTWPVTIEVYGPLGVVKGGAGQQTDAVLGAAFDRISRPRFTAEILEGFSDGRYRHHGLQGRLGGENVLASIDSDASPPPVDDLLWSAVAYVTRNPRSTPLYAFIREVDMMLPAEVDPANPKLVESGPRFSAKVRVG